MTRIDYTGRKYEIHTYDESWPEQFSREAENVKKIFNNDALAVEHIGSTAVPGMSAKPTIDILVVVESLDVVTKYADLIKASGYRDMGEYVRPDSRFFIKERKDSSDRLFNVHIFPKGHEHIEEMIRVRDYLRSHSEVVGEYNKLKLELVSKYPGDYGSYRKYKDEWMQKLIQRTSGKG